MNDRHPNVYSALEKVRLGDHRGPRSELEQLVRSSPNDAEGFFYLGLVCRWTGDLKSANDAWDRCLWLESGHERTLQERRLLKATLETGEGDTVPHSEHPLDEPISFPGFPEETIRVKPANLGRRFVAWVLDSILFHLATLSVCMIFSLSVVLLTEFGGMDSRQSPGEFRGVLAIDNWLVLEMASLFFQLPLFTFYYYMSGQTPGKRMMGIRIVDRTTFSALTLSQSATRFFGTLLSQLFFFLGYVVATLNSERRAFHDFLARTFVARTEKTPWSPAETALTVALVAFAVAGFGLLLSMAVQAVYMLIEVMENPVLYLSE